MQQNTPIYPSDPARVLLKETLDYISRTDKFGSSKLISDIRAFLDINAKKCKCGHTEDYHPRLGHCESMDNGSWPRCQCEAFKDVAEAKLKEIESTTFNVDIGDGVIMYCQNNNGKVWRVACCEPNVNQYGISWQVVGKKINEYLEAKHEPTFITTITTNKLFILEGAGCSADILEKFRL